MDPMGFTIISSQHKTNDSSQQQRCGPGDGRRPGHCAAVRLEWPMLAFGCITAFTLVVVALLHYRDHRRMDTATQVCNINGVREGGSELQKQQMVFDLERLVCRTHKRMTRRFLYTVAWVVCVLCSCLVFAVVPYAYWAIYLAVVVPIALLMVGAWWLRMELRPPHRKHYDLERGAGTSPPAGRNARASAATLVPGVASEHEKSAV